eukprot:m.260714 g.260714  ORF g.260714 m.260714 type:complete len:92 (-) comp15990_c0_seq17:10-285(-)
MGDTSSDTATFFGFSALSLLVASSTTWAPNMLHNASERDDEATGTTPMYSAWKDSGDDSAAITAAAAINGLNTSSHARMMITSDSELFSFF